MSGRMETRCDTCASYEYCDEIRRFPFSAYSRRQRSPRMVRRQAGSGVTTSASAPAASSARNCAGWIHERHGDASLQS